MDAETRRIIGELKSQVMALQLRLEMTERELRDTKAENARLRLRVSELEMQVKRDSTSSHQPPSSDPPWKKRFAKKGKSKKKRGGQPGHRGHSRALVSPERVDAFEVHRPRRCGGCSVSLDEHAVSHTVERWQVTELPEVRAHVTEHRRMRVRCRTCGVWTCAPRDTGKRSAFGPRLSAWLSALSGGYHLSRRQAQGVLQELCGVKVSLGSVSNSEHRLQRALAPVLDDAQAMLQRMPWMHMDETGWKTAGKRGFVWVSGGEKLSVFRIAVRRNQEVARAMLGGFEGLLHTDRYSGYAFYPTRKRQVCWAHLRRELKAIAAFVPEGKLLARRMLHAVRTMFRTWHRVRDGTVPYDERRIVMEPVQARLLGLLAEAMRSDCKRLRTLGKQLLKLREALFTFVRIPGAEPTNNRAERDLRQAVLWRKRSLGTQSERGNRFVECMLSLQASLRLQRRGFVDFLVRTLEASFCGRPQPLLTA